MQPQISAIDSVRAFWDRNPLFAGELKQTPGEREFFEEHRRITLHDHGGKLHPIFTAGVARGANVLDVGCGIGFWVHTFCDRGASLSACDLSETAIALTRKRLQLFGLAADVRQGNAEQLPYPSEAFDHVNCQGVIHHTPDAPACLSEFARVLRRDGTLSVSVYYKVLPLRWRWLYWAVSVLTRRWLRMRGRGRENMMSAGTPEELVRMYDGADNPIGRAYTGAQMRSMLRQAQFDIVSARRFGFPRRTLPIDLPDPVYRVLSRLFGLMIVFHCRKSS